MTNPAPTANATLIAKVQSASFYQVYQDAFRCATGLPLILIEADANEFNPCTKSSNQNPFCRILNEGKSPCKQCALAQWCATRDAANKARTVECFSGMKETAIPLRLGERVVGYFKTGQVFTSAPDPETVAKVRTLLVDSGLPDSQIDYLMRAHANTPVFEADRYAAMVTLLSAFALQVSDLMNRILLEERTSEPEQIRKAKEFIMDRIDEKITLEMVAAEVSVSTFYLCKLFKQATGLTLTEFVNRQRIELAKGQLVRTQLPVTEIAFSVGYQSLSQFNRSFLKIVGSSPSQFRKQARTRQTASV